MDVNALASLFTCLGICCLVLTGILGIAWFSLSLHRSLISNIIMVSLSTYVACALAVLTIHPVNITLSNALNSVAAVDFELRTSEIYDSWSSTNPLVEAYKVRVVQDLRKTENLLDKGNFEDSTLFAYQVIALHYLHSDCNKALNNLAHSEGKNGAALANDLKVALLPAPSFVQISSASKRKVDSQQQSREVADDLKLRLPLIWFRDYSLEHLYYNSGQFELLESLKTSQRQRREVLVKRALVMAVLPPICFLTGAVIILILLIQVLRKKFSLSAASSPEATIGRIKHYSVKSVYGTIVAFLATKLAVRQFIDCSWYFHPHINQSTSFVTTLLLASFFILSNGSALFYAYIFAMRPNKVSFLEGISFRLRSGSTGTIRMLVIGALVCLPTMTVGFFATLTSVLCGFEGTSNPIRGFEVQIAQTGNLESVISVYLQLLFLVPFIEESLIRGFLYSALRQRMNIFYSVLTSSVFFSALHLDISGFLLIFTIGAVFALVVERTKSTVPTIFAHGLWLCVLFTGVLTAF